MVAYQMCQQINNIVDSKYALTTDSETFFVTL